jgi:transposase
MTYEQLMRNNSDYPALVRRVLAGEEKGKENAVGPHANADAMLLLDSVDGLDHDPLPTLLDEVRKMRISADLDSPSFADIVREADAAASACAEWVNRPDAVRAAYSTESSKINNPNHDEPRFRYLWALARLIEWCGERDLMLCSFCHRSVVTRQDGKPMLYCVEHAPILNEQNKGGYQRGRKYQESFVTLFDKYVGPDLIEESDGNEPINADVALATKMLKLHFRTMRKGGGSAFWTIRTALSDESDKFGYLVPEDDLKLEILYSPLISDWKSYTELAMTLRSRTNDCGGETWLRGSHRTATPLAIARQWIRYVAWLRGGDNKAPVGKGRPAEIDRERALEMKAQRKSNAEIADTFNVSIHSVNAFFARLRKKGEDVPRTRGRAAANGDPEGGESETRLTLESELAAYGDRKKP